jgi:hypothetical protein
VLLKHRELKGGGELAISEVAFVTPQGRKLEGNGVVPDSRVILRLTELQGQRHTALEEAEKHLDSLKKFRKQHFLRQFLGTLGLLSISATTDKIVGIPIYVRPYCLPFTILNASQGAAPPMRISLSNIKRLMNF